MIKYLLPLLLASSAAFAQQKPPEYRTPTNPNQATNKTYVDGLIAARQPLNSNLTSLANGLTAFGLGLAGAADAAAARVLMGGTIRHVDLKALPAGTAAAPQLAPAANTGTGILMLNDTIYFTRSNLTPLRFIPDQGVSALVFAPDGVSPKVSISHTSALAHYDTIIEGNLSTDTIAPTRAYHPPDLTWKQKDHFGENGGFPLPMLAISGQNAANAAAFTTASGVSSSAGVNVQVGWQQNFNIATNGATVTVGGNGSKTFSSFDRFAISGGTDVGTVTTFNSDFIVNRTAGGAVLPQIIVRGVNASTAKTSELKVGVQDNNAGTIRALFYVPGPLNVATKNQGRLDFITEDGSITMASLQSLAAGSGTVLSMYNRTGTIPISINAGTGIITTPVLIETGTSTPTSATAACTTGQRTWDANYEYRCIATNTWKRAALSTW